MLALENSKGEGDSPKEDPVDFLGESIRVSVSLGEESVKSAEQAEEVLISESAATEHRAWLSSSSSVGVRLHTSSSSSFLLSPPLPSAIFINITM